MEDNGTSVAKLGSNPLVLPVVTNRGLLELLKSDKFPTLECLDWEFFVGDFIESLFMIPFNYNVHKNGKQNPAATVSFTCYRFIIFRTGKHLSKLQILAVFLIIT